MDIATFVARCAREIAEGLELVQAASARAPTPRAATGIPGIAASMAASQSGYTVETDFKLSVAVNTDTSGQEKLEIRLNPAGTADSMISFRVPIYVRSAEELVVVGSLDLGLQLGEVLAAIAQSLGTVPDTAEAVGAPQETLGKILEDLKAASGQLYQLSELRDTLSMAGKHALATMAAGAIPAHKREVDRVKRDPEVAAILKSVTDEIINRLDSLGTVNPPPTETPHPE